MVYYINGVECSTGVKIYLPVHVPSVQKYLEGFFPLAKKHLGSWKRELKIQKTKLQQRQSEIMQHEIKIDECDANLALYNGCDREKYLHFNPETLWGEKTRAEKAIKALREPVEHAKRRIGRIQYVLTEYGDITMEEVEHTAYNLTSVQHLIKNRSTFGTQTGDRGQLSRQEREAELKWLGLQDRIVELYADLSDELSSDELKRYISTISIGSKVYQVQQPTAAHRVSRGAIGPPVGVRHKGLEVISSQVSSDTPNHLSSYSSSRADRMW